MLRGMILDLIWYCLMNFTTNQSPGAKVDSMKGVVLADKTGIKT